MPLLLLIEVFLSVLKPGYYFIIYVHIFLNI